MAEEFPLKAGMNAEECWLSVKPFAKIACFSFFLFRLFPIGIPAGFNADS